jgi:transcription elongation GreA/GreB family factor
MSKAFLPEDAAVDEGPLVPPRPAEPQPITPAGHRRLLEERARIDPNDEATRTRALVLDSILATVRIVEPTLVDGGAGFGCEVTVEDESGAIRTYTLVGPDEVDPKAGRISSASPLGRRLLGQQEGEVIEVERGGRKDELTIVRVALAK